MNARVLAAAAGCILVTSCGSVTSNINFQAPTAGWMASPPIFGRTQVWIKQGGNSAGGSLIVLVRGAGSTKQNLFDNPAAGTANTRLTKDEHATICGNEAAEHVAGSGTGKNGRPSVFEGYSAVVRDERYLAIYVRPKDVPADPQALIAIRSLCPKDV